MTIEQERLTPTQEDRTAAADLLDEISSLLSDDGIGQVADLIRDGEYDEHEATIAFARHRLAALKSPPIAGGEGEPFPADVRRLVIAARVVAFEDVGMEAMAELDDASEAFADRVKWDGEPAEECVGGVDDDMEAVVRAASLLDRNNVVADAVKALEKDMIENVIPAIDEDRRTQARLRAESLYKPLFGPTTSGDVGKLCEQDAVADLLDRLRTMGSYGHKPYPTHHINPDGPEAAAVIEAQAARIVALETGAEHRFFLKWIGGARPPVHPEPMHGQGWYSSFDRAIQMMRRQAPDAIFVSLTEEVSHRIDRSDDARALLNPTPTEER